MAFPRTVPEVKCSTYWQHWNSRVWGFGTYKSGTRTYRRYRCRPTTGKAHTFSVLLDDTGQPATLAPSEPPPPCAKHPGAHCVRNGRYKRKTAAGRQRYRCYGDGTKRGHPYIPGLARAYVGHGFADPCDLCEQVLGVHRGEQTASRGHTWSSRTVAQGIMFMSRAQTYGQVGRWAMRSDDGENRWHRTDKPLAKGRPESVESHRRWHIAADWAETFSPVFWEPLEARMKAKALAERRRIDDDLAAGRPLRRPIVWVADEHSVFAGPKMLFTVLVVAEVEWDDRDEAHLRLRLARALPDHTTAAWMVVFDELARVPGESDEIWPDFIVADGALAIARASEIRFGGKARWVPSVWHLAFRVRKAFLRKDPPRAGTGDEALEDHLRLLSRDKPTFSSPEKWREWWDGLDALLPNKGWLASQRPLYQDAYDAVIPDLAANRIPISNAGLEELIKSTVRPMFYKRSSFCSIERTNRLTDLMICAHRGELDDVIKVARRLRADAHEHGGWSTALRYSEDPTDLDRGKPYRSLRNQGLTVRLAGGLVA